VAEQYLFASANAERTQRRLQPLHWDDALYRAADGHAREMAARASISHQYPGEAELAARGQQAGAHFSLILENVAQAPTAVRIQDAWMNSPGHRANLLDPKVNSIGIRVIDRGGELYAVEDFDNSLVSLSLGDQASAVEGVLQSTSSSLEILPASEDARHTCTMQTGYAGDRQPGFIMRYTAADLTKLPDELKQQVASGQYHQAAVGACAAATQNFSAYSIVVMLYR
jgi:hypothetical protein